MIDINKKLQNFLSTLSNKANLKEVKSPQDAAYYETLRLCGCVSGDANNVVIYFVEVYICVSKLKKKLFRKKFCRNKWPLIQCPKGPLVIYD